MAIRKSWEYPIEEDCLNSKEVAMSSISLGRMVTLPPFVTRIVQIVVATVAAGNKKFTYIQRSQSDAEMLRRMAKLADHDTFVTTRDNARIARLKAEAAQLATSAETPA